MSDAHDRKALPPPAPGGGFFGGGTGAGTGARTGGGALPNPSAHLSRAGLKGEQATGNRHKSPEMVKDLGVPTLAGLRRTRLGRVEDFRLPVAGCRFALHLN